MSTRATYSIEHKGGKSFFYIHHDNYEEGAAHYFMLMHKAKCKDDALVNRFIIANWNAEFTLSHEYHGDTEYRYCLDSEGNLTAYKVYYGEAESWHKIFSGHYAEFINKHIKKAYEHDYNKEEHKLLPYMRQAHPWADKTVIEWRAAKELKEEASEHYKLSLSFNADNPNKEIYFKKAKEIDLYLQLMRGEAC